MTNSRRFVTRSSLIAPLAIVAIAACATGVAAVGCGEPFVYPTDACSDPQCSRAVFTENSTYCVRGLPEGFECIGDADCYMNLDCRQVGSVPRCVKAGSEQVAWQGYVAVAVAVLFFGSNFIPARRIDPGNGLFFQLFMSTAILTVGFVVQLVRGASYFYPYAMLGGMFWCIGNTLAVPALKLISMGLAISIWGGSNMLLGWASGHFGFWGINEEQEQVEWIGYVGVAFAVLGVITLAFVKKSGTAHRDSLNDTEDALAYRHSSNASTARIKVQTAYESVEFGERDDISNHMSKTQMRVLGTGLAIVAGCLFGINFDPPTLLIDEQASRSLRENVKYSDNGLDYVFSHFFGIFLTALIEVVLFTGVDKLVQLPSIFTPDAYEDMILPGFLCGVGWAIAQVAWFVANDNLGLVVSFPIIALGPSIVASLWSVFLFKEIRGTRNYIILVAAFVLLAISATCTVFARNGF
jgi:glucose uptake protein GlcU